MDVLDKQDFARFEFKMSFGRVSYIKTAHVVWLFAFEYSVYNKYAHVCVFFCRGSLTTDFTHVLRGYLRGTVAIMW